MKAAFLLLTLTLALTGATQEEKKKEPFDPFADPRAELIKRAERSAKEKDFAALKEAAAELVQVSQEMSDEIERNGKEVISAKVWTNLTRAEKLLKTIRDKAK